ncbi:tRNA(Ile)(2)-agmatinylcytidine synthase [Saliphagus infecundisoli]|uniref:tRNA(Ile2) 2-agmatinylcytidine synthetase TiaS n=1 Tax=Saliphagus infecundisoli TaxID=1849069 RepID=A0ABD5QIS1_9EURY|nr:tRNA(Ile)(2)-agmatinylcytidine synthase [Saliphagus infecundisoli]
MTVVAVDDTDSREEGMCTTYVAARIASALSGVERLLLVRLNPAVEHKTRGNAALAVHADCDPGEAFSVARETVTDLAAGDGTANPGVVVADHAPEAVPDSVSEFAREAVRDHLTIPESEALIERAGYRAWGAGNGRGRIGALAAVGAWSTLSEWTLEEISYREPERWGTPREVDHQSVFAAAKTGYPAVWDTVDRIEGETVCVPHTPGPILYGIRGDDADAVRRIAARIESEPVAERQLFVTNQGTDVHLREGEIGELRNGRAYRLSGEVVSGPETREGGHVFFEVGDGDRRLECVAFEPTKRFRERVRGLRAGDSLTVCGELSGGTLKLEKFAVRDLRTTRLETPTCPDCGRRMESAGADQGYRCRDCARTAEGKVERAVERELEEGWYEVPPCARRHIAKPLVRGGFDAPVHPER